MKLDAEVFSKHPNLTICARDLASFNQLKKYFNNRILLVPDMAFCIKNKTLAQHRHGKSEGTLFLKRTDKELSPKVPSNLKEIQETADVRDWPSMEKDPLFWNYYQKLCHYGYRVERYRRLRRISRIISKLGDWYFHEHCRKQLIHEGINFVDRYRNIYTTRLHVGILSILLDKDVTIIDNSYGKNSYFFETWLTDTAGITLKK